MKVCPVCPVSLQRIYQTFPHRRRRKSAAGSSGALVKFFPCHHCPSPQDDCNARCSSAHSTSEAIFNSLCTTMHASKGSTFELNPSSPIQVRLHPCSASSHYIHRRIHRADISCAGRSLPPVALPCTSDVASAPRAVVVRCPTA